MSALEQEIFDRFNLLDKTAQQRVILQLQQKAQENTDLLKPMSPQEGLDWLRDFSTYIHNKYGDLGVNSVDLLNEAREERLDDLMGGR